MLKKLVSALALTSLAFGSGLCFNPYNHDYGISIEKTHDTNLLSNYNKTITLHNGKMQVDKYTTIEFVRYMTERNKTLVLMKVKGYPTYFVIYTECTHGKPVTVDLETLGRIGPGSSRVSDIPRYPLKFGFYKDGFWVKYLYMVLETDGDGCQRITHYYPYKLIKEHKGYKGPMKFYNLPNKLCYALTKKLEI